MPDIIMIISGYLLLASLVAFFLFAADKIAAKKGHWRIPEKTLLLSAAFGGALGAFLGMYLLRHKTKHRIFTILVPLLLVVWIALYTLISYYMKKYD